MNKIILALVILALLSGGVFYFKNQKDEKKFTFSSASPLTSSENTNQTATPAVPLPTEEDIIRTFFNLLNEKRIPEAISMMTDNITQNDSLKQQWGVSFNSWEKITLTSIEPYDFEWTDTKHTYLVNFNLQIKPGMENMWENGENTRFVTIVKQNNLWKIEGFSTGP